MENSLLGFMEMFIVFGFALGWGILELVAGRLDKRRGTEASRTDADHKRTGDL